jgi:hypothetical protein
MITLRIRLTAAHWSLIKTILMSVDESLDWPDASKEAAQELAAQIPPD